MSKRMSAGRVRRAYEFIEAHRQQYPVQVMCKVLEVAPSGYYEWLQNPISNRAKEDARLLRLIRASFIAVTAFTERRVYFWIYARPARHAVSTESND